MDCVKLAGRKVLMWHLRQHPKVMALKFKADVKRVDRVNARVAYILDDMTEPERKLWEGLFDEVPAMLTEAERKEWYGKLTDVALSSDAFFPFRDNIDQVSLEPFVCTDQPSFEIVAVLRAPICSQLP